jgi:hypothetical protein
VCRSYLHFAKVRHTTGFTNANAFIQLCLTSTLFCYTNKTDANQNNDIWVLQHKIPPWQMKAKAAFYFLILCLTTFIPGKKSLEKRCRSSGPLPNLGRFTVVSKIQNTVSSNLLWNTFKLCTLHVLQHHILLQVMFRPCLRCGLA